jgi:hypothetical protein
MGGRRWGRWWPGVLPVALMGVGCDALDFLRQPGGLAIQRFAASPADITAGGSTALSWDVEGAESVQIAGIGTVPSKGSRQVSPAWSTTYVLTARAGTSSATATLQVVVQPGPSPSPSPSGSPSPSPIPSVTPYPYIEPQPEPVILPLAVSVPFRHAGRRELRPTGGGGGQLRRDHRQARSPIPSPIALALPP